MKGLWSYIGELEDLEIFVLFCIVIFSLATIIFITLILVSRVKKIKSEIYRKRKTAHINQILFSIAFDGKSFENIKGDPEFAKNWKRKSYKHQFLSELIKLHRLYGGEIALNLQKCYRDFRLIQISYAKIRSRKWENKCAGIQELSEMEIKKAIPVIRAHTNSKNDTVKMVAIIEVMHLKGLSGLILLKDYQEPLNDWIQLNLLESIKEANSDEIPDFGYMLKTTNESIVVLGLRLLKLFHQNQHLNTVKNLQQSSSRKIAQQAISTYSQLAETSAETVTDNGRESKQIPYYIDKPRVKGSYSRTAVKIIFIIGFLIVVAIIFAVFFLNDFLPN